MLLSGGSFLGGSLVGSLGSVLGGLCLGSCLSLSLGLGGSDFGTLLSYGLSLSLVLLSFVLKTFLVVGLLVFTNFVANSLELSILLGFPSVETFLSLFLGESALLHATLEVLHEHNALA